MKKFVKILFLALVLTTGYTIADGNGGAASEEIVTPGQNCEALFGAC